jgi:hypothetical protein
VGALEKLLDEHQHTFDVGRLFSPELERLDTCVPPPHLYKYYSFLRADFFNDPLIRFTQRTQLNDPFELSKRFTEFASASTQTLFAEYIRGTFQRIAGNKGILIELLKEELATKGIYLKAEEVADLAGQLMTPAGNDTFKAIMANAIEQIEPFVGTAFSAINSGAQQSFDEATSKLGILSLSSTGVSRAMWSLYADSGRGFVVEFDTNHSFFKADNGRALLWPVEYTNDVAGDFFSNPLSILLTKHQEYSFEQEWRMIKKLSECDEVRIHNGEDICLWRLRPGMIKSVIFGYNYDEAKLAQHAATLQVCFDPNVSVHWAFANRRSGNIDLLQIS